MNIAARMKCQRLEKTVDAEYITFTAVYSADRSDPNYTWSQFTPSGELKLTVTNKDVWGRFIPGDTYQINFEKVS